MKIRIEISLEHAVAFIADPYNSFIAPTNIDNYDISENEGCIAFRVRPYFDGGADITVSSEEPGSQLGCAYEGNLLCKSGILSISDSNNFNYLFIPVKSPLIKIKIWRSLFSIEDVWVHISSISEY